MSKPVKLPGPDHPITTAPHPASRTMRPRSESGWVIASTGRSAAMMRYTLEGAASIPMFSSCGTTHRSDAP